MSECSAYTECEVVYASPIIIDENGQECIDYADNQPKACAEFGCSADPTITFAKPSDSEECWMIASGCLPDGWSYCDATNQDCP